jgi:hypothetical protein
MGSRFQGYFLLAVYPRLNFKKVEQIALHSTLIFFCRVNKTQEGVRLCVGEGEEVLYFHSAPLLAHLKTGAASVDTWEK